MPGIFRTIPTRILAALAALTILAAASVPAIRNMAVVASANSKLTDVPLADLVRLCKGTSQGWPDGKSFVLVLKNPEPPEMHGVLQKLFNGGPAEAKAAIAKLNEARQAIRIVESDEDLLRVVDSTPGAIGNVDVYAINSSVKVLRVDGTLPFVAGYVLASVAGKAPGRRLVLCGHTDTVPLNAGDPGVGFSGRVEDGRLHGRGSVDGSTAVHRAE